MRDKVIAGACSVWQTCSRTVHFSRHGSAGISLELLTSDAATMTVTEFLGQALQIPATAVINSEAAKLDDVAKAGSATPVSSFIQMLSKVQRQWYLK